MKEMIRKLRKYLQPTPVISEQDYQKGLEALSHIQHLEIPAGDFTKTVWMYWDSGLDNAPEVVQLSYKSWVTQNPDYQVILLNEANISDILGFNFNDVFNCFTVDLKAAGKSDFLRIFLLYKFGGVWADATSFCLKPLDQWLDMENTPFFSFREKYSDDRQLVSWFLAARQGAVIPKRLLEVAIEYLYQPHRKQKLEIRGLNTTRKLAARRNLISKAGSGYPLLEHMERKGFAPYFWLFYLFNEVVSCDDQAETWQQIQLLSNNYAELDDDFSQYRNAFIAKQTYRDKYVQGERYQERITFLKQEIL